MISIDSSYSMYVCEGVGPQEGNREAKENTGV